MKYSVYEIYLLSLLKSQGFQYMKSQSNPHILFVCHESSRTGAPVFLLHFINWLKVNTKVSFHILIDKEGSLTGEFKKLGPVSIVRPQKPSLIHKIWQKISLSSYAKHKLRQFVNQEIDIVYLNTVTNGLLSSILRNMVNAKIITHIHELESVIRSAGERNIKLIKENSSHFFAASGSVKKNLVKNHHIPAHSITVHYECIDIARFEGIGPVVLDDELSLRPDDFIVGGAGFVDYRKGFDVFIQSAEEVCINRGFRQIKFVWIGEFGRGKEKMVRKMIEKGNLGKQVFFLGERKNPFSYYRLFDIFFLTSREDPFPIVMLENAYLGNPVLGFKNTGGFEEFAENNQNLVIDRYDAVLAADNIIQWCKSTENIRQTGENLKKQVEENFTIQKKGAEYLQNVLDLI